MNSGGSSWDLNFLPAHDLIYTRFFRVEFSVRVIPRSSRLLRFVRGVLHVRHTPVNEKGIYESQSVVAPKG